MTTGSLIEDKDVPKPPPKPIHLSGMNRAVPQPVGPISSPYSRFNSGMYPPNYSGGNFAGPAINYGQNYQGAYGFQPQYPVLPQRVDSASMAQQMEANTRATFQLLDQVVQAFSGFAQMLDSTFYATYSSFNAMIGVVEQFKSLRDYLSQVFSLFSLIKMAKAFLNRMRGKTSRNG